MSNKYSEFSQIDRSKIYKRVHNSTNMCLKKKSYIDEELANNRIKEIQKERPNYLRAYQCPKCHMWHLTSKKSRENTKLSKCEKNLKDRELYEEKLEEWLEEKIPLLPSRKIL